MTLFVLLSVINVVVIGLICSYTDIKSGKIYNKVIESGCLAGLLILALFYGRGVDSSYFYEALINSSIAVAFGYALWFCKKWSAGDAKLFSFLASFMPLCFYQNWYVKFFPSLNILVNSFIVVMLFMLYNFFVYIVKYCRARSILTALPGINKSGILNFSRMILSCVPVIYSMSFLLKFAFLRPVPSVNLIVFFIIFFLYAPLLNKKNVSSILSVISLFIIGYLFFFDAAGLLVLLHQVAVYVIFISVIRFLFNLYIRKKEIVSIGVNDLRPGCVLVDNELKRILKMTNNDVNKNLLSMRSYSLTSSQIEVIRSLCGQDDVFQVYRTIPLGLFLFIGAVFTLISGDSLIRVISRSFAVF